MYNIYIYIYIYIIGIYNIYIYIIYVYIYIYREKSLGTESSGLPIHNGWVGEEIQARRTLLHENQWKRELEGERSSLMWL